MGDEENWRRRHWQRRLEGAQGNLVAIMEEFVDVIDHEVV